MGLGTSMEMFISIAQLQFTNICDDLDIGKLDSSPEHRHEYYKREAVCVCVNEKNIEKSTKTPGK